MGILVHKIIIFTFKGLKLVNMGSQDEAQHDMYKKYQGLEYMNVCVSLFAITLFKF